MTPQNWLSPLQAFPDIHCIYVYIILHYLQYFQSTLIYVRFKNYLFRSDNAIVGINFWCRWNARRHASSSSNTLPYWWAVLLSIILKGINQIRVIIKTKFQFQKSKKLIIEFIAVFATFSCNLDKVKLLTAADSFAKRICPGDEGAINVECSSLGIELDAVRDPPRCCCWICSFLDWSGTWPCRNTLFFWL